MEVRRIKGWASDDTLEHHGIKGQKWGIRRYQNKDGSLTTAGKARYLKTVSKDILNTSKAASKSDKMYYDAAHDVADKINENKSYMELDSYKDFKEKETKFRDYENSDKYVDYFDSKEHEKDAKRAYKDTLEYLKKEEPEYIKEIVKNNNGSTKDLDAYHDFRKLYEGYLDTYLDEGRQKFNEKHKESYETYTKLENEYNQSREKFVKDLCGKYRNKKISYVDSLGYKDVFSRESVHDIVNFAIYYLEDEDKR